MGEMILPGARIGIIGGGQLGKMLAKSAQALGYQIVIWSEEENCPACQVTANSVIGKYTDMDKLQEFIKQVDVVTVETEHIPLATLEAVEKTKQLYPSAEIVGIAQNRLKEKSWLDAHGFPVVPFKVIRSIADIEAFIQEVAGDIVIKTITGGYDGKGQIKLADSSNRLLAAEQLKRVEEWLKGREVVIAEEWLSSPTELSVIAARNRQEEFIAFPVGENEHRNHILHQTNVPARIAKDIQEEAIRLTNKLMEEMNYIGLLCVELFCDAKGQLYINELAPRPHNSGHYTADAAITSQFEQTIRAICSLPLGKTDLLSPSVMTNLLGDLWQQEFKVLEILKHKNTKLHLYGKAEARNKRKMGHYTTLAKSVDDALVEAEKIYINLEEQND